MPTRKLQRGSRSYASLKRKSPQKVRMSDALGRIQGLESEVSQVIREMQEKVRQLECLNEFSHLMNATLDTKLVRKKALEATCQLIGCEFSLLLMVDPTQGDLYWESLQDFSDSNENRFFSRARLPIDDRSLAGYVAMTEESVIVNDLENDARYSKSFKDYKKKFLQSEHKMNTVLCVPLKSKDKIIGVLHAFNKLPSIPPRSSVHSWADFYENDKRLLETLSNQVAAALDNSYLYTEIKKSFFETVEALAEAIEKKDHYTGGHTKRVVYYAMCIAKYLNLTKEQLEQVRLSAILHDVGKIGIEDKILKKQAPLDPDEWKVMQTHPDLGYDIMRRVEGLKDVMGGMRYHHERWDGKGYPLGLKGEEIPFIARIISVADTYDAMVSTRPYRKGIDPKKAYDEILKYKGTQFDPTVVDAFTEAFLKEKMGKGSGGSSHSDSEDLDADDSGAVGKGRLSNCD